MKKGILIMILVLIMTATTPLVSLAKASDSGVDSYNGELPELQNAIASQAIRCAWPLGQYHDYANPEYSKALTQAYGSRSGWGDRTKAGKSCDVFVGTVIRSCGYDTSFPRGLAEDKTYLPASDKFKKMNITRAADMEPGDIIFYINKGPGGHICVYVEIGNEGYLAEASYSLAKVGRITGKAHDWNPSRFKVFWVYRPSKDCTTSFKEGDKSDEVVKVQEFLKWAGFFHGKADGIFGKETTNAVKAFQKEAGIKVTGSFGSKELKAIRNYNNDRAGAMRAQ